MSHLRIAHRKTTLTPQLADQLVLMLRHGVPLATTAAVNVSRATLYHWLAREEPEFVSFREQVEQARGQGEAALVLQVSRESTTHWQAGAWLLTQVAHSPTGTARISP